jgi:hypothetical protein
LTGERQQQIPFENDRQKSKGNQSRACSGIVVLELR